MGYRFLHPKHRHNITKIIFFGIIWLIFGVLYTLIEKGILGEATFYPSTGNSYEFSTSFFFTAISSSIMGLVLGAIEVLFLNKKFASISFGRKIFYKTSVYFISICLFLISLIFIVNSHRLNLSVFHVEVIRSVFLFIKDFVFISILLYIAVIIGIALFISEIGDNIGQGVLKNFFLGKYHTPVIEDRIFMFIDMKSSTTIAEKLGHLKYYELLNDYYADLTKAILETSGEIYQYVGDEVVVSWLVDSGLDALSCIDCYFMCKKIIKENSKYYVKKFNMVPDFKAGIHVGSITTGELGVIKKEIVFTGDILNTTSRIQGECNKYSVDILISEDLKMLLPSDHHYSFSEIGSFILRGKTKEIKLLTVFEKPS
jgi:adenylate cyclase